MEDRERRNYREVTLLDYLLVFLKRKRFILALTVGATLLTAAVAFIIPKTYRAESKILSPAQNQTLSFQLLGQLGGMPGFVPGNGMGIKTTNDLYVGLLRTRAISDAVIDRLKLMERYRTKYREDARRKLLEQLDVQDEKKSGIITVAVEDKDPKRAAEMANAFVAELKNFNKGLAITEAAQRRLFYEEQLKEVKDSLISAEESLKIFQEKTGAVKIEDQAKAVIQGIAELRAQVAAREVQLRVLRTYATRHNVEAQRLEEEIRGLREQMGRLEARSRNNGNSTMSTGRMPQLGTDYVRSMRDVKFNETLHEMLLKQLEAARLDEARGAAIIQVIEQAVPPEKKIRPRRAQMVGAAFVVSLLVSLLGALFLEALEKSRQNSESRERLEQIRRLAGLKWWPVS